MLFISTRAQAWYMDFAIGMLLFTFTLVIYFGYTTNFQEEGQSDLGVLLDDAKAISSSLALSGYPDGWDSTNVARIGLADERKINTTKLKSFKELNYTGTKSKLSTTYDYFMFLANDKGEVLNINGICGVGNTVINVTYNIKSAYYYSSESDKFLKDFMKNTFKADIYFGDDGDDLGDIDGLASNLSKYGFLVLEHPDVSPSNYNWFKEAVENYSSRGGLSMVSGQLVTANDKELFGVDFKKKSGQSTSDRNSTVNNTDQYLSFSAGDIIVFSQAYYVENKSSSASFKQIATFNQDGKNAAAKWKYGNGTVYFFSDFDTSYFSGNFTNVIEDLAKSMVEGTCSPINVSGVSHKKLVKAERYLTYNSKIIKMIVYVWE